MARKLVLIDASSNIFRAFYAIPPLTNAAGVPTNATLGFETMLQKVLRETRPEFVVVVWDAPGPKRRKEMYADYKATRESTPEDLLAQFANIRRLVDAHRIAAFEFEGEEADDVIATLVHHARKEKLDVEIVSTDKDLMQLVDERVTLVDTMREKRFGPAEVEARFGVPPEKMLDLRSLVGDSSDNIPGVKGIGEKGAANLINEYGSLDELLARVADIKQKRAREALEQGADMARLSRDLSRLREDLPVPFDLEQIALREPDRESLVQIFKELEFTRLLDEFGESRDPGPALETTTEIVRDASALRALVERLHSNPSLAASCVLEPESAMSGELIALCVAEDRDHAWLIATREIPEETALEILKPVFAEADRSWSGHDLKRLAVALSRRGVEIEGRLLDTSVAAYVANPSQPVSKPEVLTRSYLGLEISSAEVAFGKGAKRQTADSLSLEDLAAFWGTHTAVALELEAKIEEQLESSDQQRLLREIESPLIRVLADMERLGVRIDEDRLAVLSTRLGSDLGQLEARIYQLAGEEFKISSPKQLQKILFEKLALPPTKKTKTGFSTDESVLEELASQGFELPSEILSYRRMSKLKSTYVDALPKDVHPETGRIHTTFNQTVAATGRLSSTNPNLQNIPIRTPAGQEIRAAFIPAEGLRLLSADYSQIELRILAHVSQDDSLVKAFREGADIHVRTASQVFGIAPEDVSDEQRSRTKAINFGIIYGQSSFGLARTLRIAQAEAKQHIDSYFERYPGVKAFLKDSVARAKQSGFAETLDGRRRYLPDLHSRNRVVRQAAERMATNSVIQGTAADYIKRAMIAVWQALRAGAVPGARMILQVHDELLFEVSAAEEPILRALVLDKMQNVGNLSVPLEVHLGSGGSWLEAH
ncbi:MAG: DNA polymerase I [bacterium]|nr:DNA polymerase I [bacterium]